MVDWLNSQTSPNRNSPRGTRARIFGPNLKNDLKRRTKNQEQPEQLGQHAVLPLPCTAKPRAVSGKRLAVGNAGEAEKQLGQHAVLPLPPRQMSPNQERRTKN